MAKGSTRRLAVLMAASLALLCMSSTDSSTNGAPSMRPGMQKAGTMLGTAPAPACGLATAVPAGQEGGRDWSRARVVRDIKNAAAMTYITGRAAGDPAFRDVQERAATMLRERGLTPTDHARVLTIQVPRMAPKTVLLERMLGLVAPRVTAEEYDGFEVYIESWNDDDDSTWEGNIWVQELATGAWVSANEQKQLPPAPYIVNWADQVGTSQRPLQQCRKSGSVCGYCGSWEAANCNLGRAIDDSWPFCVGFAWACGFTGPMWPECASVACIGPLLGNFLNRTKQHFATCWLDEAEREACEGGA